MIPLLTLTGADERTDLAELATLDAEIGLLYTTHPEGRNRYPRWEWILEASRCLRKASLHVCGRDALRTLMTGDLDVCGFQRIQLNGKLAITDVQHVCQQFPGHTVITQHNRHNQHLLAVEAHNHAVLVDASGGRGISPQSWASPDTAKPVGFAGGLGPDNLSGELIAISAIARRGWWADMEGKLRVDDWFSIALAEDVLGRYQTAVRKMLEQTGHKYPHLFHRWNRAHQGAYRKGAIAFHRGDRLDACPYTDHRKWSGGLTWSRAFENAWRDGWRDAKQQISANTAEGVRP